LNISATHSALYFDHFHPLQLKSYVDEWYTGRRMTVVGVGVSHDELVKHAEASLSGVPEGMTTNDKQCEYVGGKSIRTHGLGAR
jgi:predicted Zn-dependent peptidase